MKPFRSIHSMAPHWFQLCPIEKVPVQDDSHDLLTIGSVGKRIR
jgi:hypothetical protein